MKNWVIPAALGILSASAAQAEWVETSSAHFVVYANDSKRDAEKFSQQLERYNAALSLLTGTPDMTPSPSNRLTVYVVRGEATVRKLYGENSQFIGGFYVPNAGGSLAIVPQVDAGGSAVDSSMTTLLHEYTHHFMISGSDFPMPRWYSEGSAEFFAAAGFPADGGVRIGLAAMNRAAELLVPGFARNVTINELLDPSAKPKSKAYDAFYGKSWLLVHYLTFDPARKGQLRRYLQLLAQGKTSLQAGSEAFGDLGTLAKDLDAYLGRSRIMSLTVKPSMVPIGPVTVRALSAGEAAMMPVRIRSKLGVDEQSAKQVLADAREVAKRFPDDPAVLAALAEAEHDAGNDRESIAAAEAAIARDPGQTNAYVQKGLSLFRMAADAPDRAKAYQQARVAFVALNRREPDHPLPLIYYYRSFVAQGLPPNDLAFRGLARASELAPFDLGLKMTLATEQIRRGLLTEARRSLGPVAFNPHGGGLAQAAQRVLARIDANPAWDGQDLEAVIGNAAAGDSE